MRFRLSLALTGLTLASGLMLGGTAAAQVSVGVSINVAPPELPVYEQPPIPAVGYMWTPGYWAYGDGDYYWVPGTWVEAPQPGFLWTPGYWGWGGGGYFWHAGYWGPHVGFYGGVNYGYGYGGAGFEGGEWRGGAFYYNRGVTNVPDNVHITNVYNRTVVNNVTVNRVSFNGGSGGTAARPTPQEVAAEHEQHLPPVAAQAHQEQVARAEPALRASQNHGAPPVAATAHAGSLSGAGVVGARGAAPFTPHPVAAHPAVPPAGGHPATNQPAVRELKPAPPHQGAPAAGPPAGAAHSQEVPPPRVQQRAPEHAPPAKTEERAPERGNEEHEH